GQPLQHRRVGGGLVQVHRLRVEFGGKGKNLLARDVARSERAEVAGREVFEGQRCHLSAIWIEDYGGEARMWPLFAAISTRPPAWLVRQRRVPLPALTPDLPEAIFGASPVPSGIRFLTRRRTIDARFSGSVSVGPLHHAHDNQDVLLAGHRFDRAVRPVRDLFGACRDGNQPVRRVHPAIVLDRRRRGRRGVLAYRRRIHPDRLPHQRASRRDPRSGANAIAIVARIAVRSIRATAITY